MFIRLYIETFNVFFSSEDGSSCNASMKSFNSVEDIDKGGTNLDLEDRASNESSDLDMSEADASVTVTDHADIEDLNETVKEDPHNSEEVETAPTAHSEGGQVITISSGIVESVEEPMKHTNIPPEATIEEVKPVQVESPVEPHGGKSNVSYIHVRLWWVGM